MRFLRMSIKVRGRHKAKSKSSASFFWTTERSFVPANVFVAILTGSEAIRKEVAAEPRTFKYSCTVFLHHVFIDGGFLEGLEGRFEHFTNANGDLLKIQSNLFFAHLSKECRLLPKRHDSLFKLVIVLEALEEFEFVSIPVRNWERAGCSAPMVPNKGL